MRDIPIFSEEVFQNSLVNANAETKIHVLNILLENLSEIKEIKAPVMGDKEGWIKIRDLAHRYSSSATAIGVELLGSKLKELEFTIDTMRLEEAKEMIRKLKALEQETGQRLQLKVSQLERIL